jgi:hypothetical protein
MSTEYYEQPIELTYLDETVHTIQLTLYDSDKENHTPDIRFSEITELERTTETSPRGDSIERIGDSTGTSLSDQNNQDLPTDIQPDGGSDLTETTRTMGTIRDVQNDDVSHRALREIPLRPIQTDDARPEDRRPSQERDEGTHHTGAITSTKLYRSFDHLRTTDEVFDRITYLARLTGNLIDTPERKRLAALWILLRDNRFVAAVTYQARAVFNWHCADLIETFVNLAKLEWNGILYPGNATEQLGLDLLRRIIAADVERYYVMATEDVKNNQYGKIPAKENPIDLLFFTHHHRPHQIVPDQHHILEYFRDTRERVQQITFLIDQVLTLTGQIKDTTNWTTKVYPEGTDLMNITADQQVNLNRFITNIETRAYGNSMRPYAANRRCIHCQGTHASEDHHLSVSVPIMSNSGRTGLSPPQEQTQTNTDNNASHKHKNTRFALPTQQSAFAASQQQQ